jgi:hypothetical protein
MSRRGPLVRTSDDCRLFAVLALLPLLREFLTRLFTPAIFHPDLFRYAFLTLLLNGLHIVVVLWLFLCPSAGPGA